MMDMKLLDKIDSKHGEGWWVLRQMESVLVAAKELPCFHSLDESSMESFDHVEPILEICLQKVKLALSEHEQISDQICKLRHFEREQEESNIRRSA